LKQENIEQVLELAFFEVKKINVSGI